MVMLAQNDIQNAPRLRQAALAYSTSVWTWTETAGLRVADGNVLLALSATGGVPADVVAERSGLPLDVVYPALHRLTDRGYVLEEHRCHSLTAEGQRLVADFVPPMEGTS